MNDDSRRFADKFALRMPDGMRDEIARVAETNNRSMNAEIVARLQTSLASTTIVSVTNEPSATEWMFALAKELGELQARVEKLEKRAGR